MILSDTVGMYEADSPESQHRLGAADSWARVLPLPRGSGAGPAG